MRPKQREREGLRKRGQVFPECLRAEERKEEKAKVNKGRGFPEHIVVGAKEKGNKDEVIQKSFKEARLLGE